MFINVIDFVVMFSEFDSCINYVFCICFLCNGDDSDFSQFEFDICDGLSFIRDLIMWIVYWIIVFNLV